MRSGVPPHKALKTNTIFEVIKAKGGGTAWADKHPADDLVNGPSGNGIDDLYTPEITNVNGIDATASMVCTVENDQKKVVAIISQIHGKKHIDKQGSEVVLRSLQARQQFWIEERDRARTGQK